MKERLQKIIANSGLCSRRNAEELIIRKRVVVNGEIAYIGDKADIEKDQISVSGKPLNIEQKKYVMLNKPTGYSSTLFDPFQRKIVSNLIRAQERLYPVGRLDKDSEGLIIMTNDGKFANRVMHPRYEINKTYYIEISKPIRSEHIREIERGLKIEGKKTAPSKIKKLSIKEIEITIHEGRNRIIRKMLEKLGYNIKQLVRIAIGKLELGNLKSGKSRKLTKKEINLIFKL